MNSLDRYEPRVFADFFLNIFRDRRERELTCTVLYFILILLAPRVSLDCLVRFRFMDNLLALLLSLLNSPQTAI